MDAADVVVDRDVWPPGPDANDPVVQRSFTGTSSTVNPAAATVSSGFEGINQAGGCGNCAPPDTNGDVSTIPLAMDAVRQWTYRPTLVTGQPVEVATEIDKLAPIQSIGAVLYY